MSVCLFRPWKLSSWRRSSFSFFQPCGCYQRMWLTSISYAKIRAISAVLLSDFLVRAYMCACGPHITFSLWPRWARLHGPPQRPSHKPWSCLEEPSYQFLMTTGVWRYIDIQWGINYREHEVPLGTDWRFNTSQVNTLPSEWGGCSVGSIQQEPALHDNGSRGTPD